MKEKVGFSRTVCEGQEATLSRTVILFCYWDIFVYILYIVVNCILKWFVKIFEQIYLFFQHCDIGGSSGIGHDINEFV